MAELILLTGASGFIGTKLWRPLRDRGFDVRCLTRQVDNIHHSLNSRTWVEGDLSDVASLERALEGCDAAFFLAHALETGVGYEALELAWAENFAEASRRNKIEHLIYLGAPEPAGERSRHIQSRIEVGQILRDSGIPTTELRASMVVGAGGASWTMIREIANRLGILTLPSWMESKTQPVSIDDAVFALAEAARLKPESSSYWNIPGPDTLSAREILEITARLSTGRRPPSVYFPDVTPSLTTRWLDVLVSDDTGAAREIALGMTTDVIMTDRIFWDQIARTDLMSFEESAERALQEEGAASDGREGNRLFRSLARLVTG